MLNVKEGQQGPSVILVRFVILVCQTKRLSENLTDN